jgi:hypothetical protein
MMVDLISLRAFGRVEDKGEKRVGSQLLGSGRCSRGLGVKAARRNTDWKKWFDFGKALGPPRSARRKRYSDPRFSSNSDLP